MTRTHTSIRTDRPQNMAAAAAEARVHLAEDGAEVPAAASASWALALDGFRLDLRKRKRRASTIKGHVSHLRTLIEAHPAGPASVTPTDLLLWLETRGASRRHAWVSARVFYAYAVRCGLLEESPAPAPPPRRRPDGPSLHALPEAWREALTSYVTELQANGRTVRTIELRLTYLRSLARRYAHLGTPWALTYDDLVHWLGEHHQWSPETRKSARGTVVGFYGHAVRRGLLTDSPAEPLSGVKVPRAVPRPTPTNALHAALAEADDRGRLLILLAAYAGLRAAEIARVRPSTDVQEGVLYVTGKGGHQRVVPMHPLITQALAAEQARREAGAPGSGFRRGVHPVGPESYLFPSAGGSHITPGHVTVLLARLLPDGWTAHTLRHRFASEAYAAVLDIRAVQELLGHSSPTTTARYTAVPSGHLLRAVLGVQ